MGILPSVFEPKRYTIFLNISFLFVSLVLLVFLSNSTEFPFLRSNNNYSSNGSNEQSCEELESLDGYKAKCIYLKSNSSCVSQGYIDYLQLFYCTFGEIPLLGHFVLFLWLLVLFYLLGNTASGYFCYSLESLSSLLKLSPTISGVTLLSLGNGAPDLFASIVSFMGEGTSEIGLSTILGGASFVTCVVVGTISFFIHKKRVQVNKAAFVRDVCCFLFVLVPLILILVYGKINLFGAIAFSAMYFAYVGVVYLTDVRWNAGERYANNPSSGGSDLSIPILSGVESECRTEARRCCFCDLRSSANFRVLLWILKLPLDLPRKLTIPVASEENWCKPVAVTSVTLAPILLSALVVLEYDNTDLKTSMLICGIGLLFGLAFGILAYFTTEKACPPKKCLILWAAGGFLMSVAWSYVTAQELVGLLVSIGYIAGISPSILGLTILAWGNSLGDLITNVTMALKHGPAGAQVAISGCYAGPIFNTLFGLGLSMVFSAWSAYPSPVLVPSDYYLFETLGFLIAGLIWALVVLPWRDMRLDVMLGAGLVVVYLISISLRIIQTLGFLQFVFWFDNQTHSIVNQ